MPDLFMGTFLLTVQGATNNTLGQNGQGVCGVTVHFNHTAICDLMFTLTSPSGQTVTLIGPIGQYCTSGGNSGTDWNVTFLPCGTPVSPDPGFSPTWNSNQPWGANNSYSGSYYPYIGCLNNFSGSVNGTWTLTVTDGQANDTGNLLDYTIMFCDESGINCFTCAANAGNLPQPDVFGCQGSSDLNLDLPPEYTGPIPAPPTSDYSYEYVIAGTGGVIKAFSSTPDLSAYPAGTYTVCGLSYLTANANLIPSPNGTLTITQLSNQLNSSHPPFCGKITPNCVNVTIYPKPVDVSKTASICAPDCYDFFGESFCLTGTYSLDQVDAKGCHYNAILHLTVFQPVTKNINEIICPGGCSTNPSFPSACGAGTYQTTLTNVHGCDSLVTLTLTVMNIHAAILPPPVLSCAQPLAVLQGTGSTTGAGTSYTWTASSGGHLVGATNQINATVDKPGHYKLKVCRTQGGITCCDTAAVNVTANLGAPVPPVVAGPDTVCQGQTVQYTVAAINNASSYNWVVTGGSILSGNGTDTIQVIWNGNLAAGTVCANAANACGQSNNGCRNVVINSAPAQPVITGDSVLCTGTQGHYTITPINGATGYTWTVPAGGTIVSGQNTTALTVNWTAAPGGPVCASALNTCGTGGQACFPVVVYAQPVAHAGLEYGFRSGYSLFQQRRRSQYHRHGQRQRHIFVPVERDQRHLYQC
jgi:subtilisin-like proprotein convertase family protein